MHELGICDALLKMVRSIAEEEDLEEISRITVEVGSLSGVVPAYMLLQDVEFVVEELEGTARCMDCGEEFPADVNRLRCPHCGGERLTPLTGRDLTLKEILAT